MDIKKIVITGGPCAGKTTGMSWIQNHLSRLGYTVLFIPETATELISGGVCPWTCGTNLDYQKCQVRLQLTKEEIFEQAARTMGKDKILIVCDRGFMDNKAYMTDEEFAAAAASVGLDTVSARDRYDAVFHLVTAAAGAEEFYSSENNAARYETAEQARALDDRLIAAWTGHPYLRIIDNSSSLDEKMKKLINEIISFLGEPDRIEIEKKYLIEMPDLEQLTENHACRKIDIIQTYLARTENLTRRVRQRGEDGNYVCTETIKRRISPTRRLETERRLTEDQYLELLEQADPSVPVLHKTRYCFAYDRQYFEIDVYPFWKDKALVQIEVADETTEVRFPEDVHVIREVTGEKEYRNSVIVFAAGAEQA